MAQPSPEISRDAVNLIVRNEVSNEAAYRHSLESPTWPGGASGVTIGIGYDIGYVSADEFMADWTGLLSGDVLARLRNCAGIKGAPASRLISSLADIDVPWEAAKQVFEHASLLKSKLATIRAFPSSIYLSPDSFGALVSLVFNRGSDTRDLPRRHEMYLVAQAMENGQVSLVPGLILAMRKVWEDDEGNALPGFAGLITRREEESALFDRGLDEDSADLHTPTTTPSLDILKERADELDGLILAAVHAAAGIAPA